MHGNEIARLPIGDFDAQHCAIYRKERNAVHRADDFYGKEMVWIWRPYNSKLDWNSYRM